MSTANDTIPVPGKISSIVPQKNNRSRYSIFIDDQFLIGVSESVLADFGLSKGDEMTMELWDRIQASEYKQTIKSYILKLISRRDHSRKELLDKALKKDYPEQLTIEILEEFERKNYIDDSRFAEKFAADKVNLNRWGPAKIRSALIKKGINSNQIDKGIESAYHGADIESIFKELVNKKSYRLKEEENLFKRKKKIFDYLKRKGFKTDQILRHLDNLENSLT